MVRMLSHHHAAAEATIVHTNLRINYVTIPAYILRTKFVCAKSRKLDVIYILYHTDINDIEFFNQNLK